MMSNGSSEQSFSSSRRTVHEHSFGLSNTERLKYFGVFDGQFDNFFHFLDLLVETSNHVVGGVWDFFYLSEGRDTFMRDTKGSTFVGSTL